MTPGQAEQVAAAKVESVVFVGWCTCTMNRKVLNSPRRPTCARLVYVRTSGTRSRWPRMSRRERLSNVVRRRADRPRTKTDKIYAFEDRCAHRQMPSSCGVVVGETLRCCYRARFYDEDGSCAVPYLPEGASTPRGVRAYPVRRPMAGCSYSPATRRLPRRSRCRTCLNFIQQAT